MKIYIPENRSLAFIEKKATSEFWDKHWEVDDLRNQIINCRDSWFIEIMKKYLPGDKGIILEGGCGRSHLVHAISYQGYNAVGIDFAEKTVKRVNEAVPEIDVRYGDVRNLPFRDGEIAGYWSIGVVEHFWDGYEKIIKEMMRVIRTGGYLFITFPYMSPLRRLKAYFDLYDKKLDKDMLDKFYQFALDPRKFTDDLKCLGFTLKEQVPFDGIKGVKDEVRFLKKPLQKLYDYNGTNVFIIKIKSYLDTLFRPFASHCILLVFQKRIE